MKKLSTHSLHRAAHSLYTLLLFSLLMLLVCSPAWGASPLETSSRHKFKDSSWGYTSPSVSYLGFSGRDYLKANPGHLWYKNWLMSALEIEAMGNNFLPSRWDAGSYANASAVTIAKGGRLWSWEHFTFYTGVRAGTLTTRSIQDSSGSITYTTPETTQAFLGLEIGLRLDLWRFWLTLHASTLSADLNVLGSSQLELGVRLARRWRLGLLSEYAQRELTTCSDESDPGCTYDFSLNYTALFVAFKLTRKWWIRAGVVLFSSFSVGPSNNLNVIERDLTSVFLSLE